MQDEYAFDVGYRAGFKSDDGVDPPSPYESENAAKIFRWGFAIGKRHAREVEVMKRIEEKGIYGETTERRNE